VTRLRAAARVAALALAATLLAGCAAQRAHDEGLVLVEEGRMEEGVARLQEAVRLSPDNLRYRMDLLTRREYAVNQLLALANAERAAGRLERAESLYRRVLAVDPANPRAQARLAALQRDRRHADSVKQAQGLLKKGDVDGAEARLRSVLSENPRQADARALLREIDEQRVREALAAPALKSRHTKPVTLEFRDASLKMVFDALSRTSGINFILDKEVRGDARTTIYARQVSVEDAIDLILLPNQLEKKVLSENSILVYPNTPQKLREYQDLIMKSFYLENADVKQTLNMIKTMLKTKDVFIDEKINLLVMRDTPEVIRLAEKLVSAQDLAEAEVMLEVEVLEISHTRLMELGVKWPDQFTFGVVDTTGDPFVISDLRGINRDRITMNSPSATLNLKKTDGDTNLLASPRIRVRNREKARILIGDRVPVISSQVTPSTGTPVVTEIVQYLDVGLKLEVEPNVHLDDQVAIKVALEVSTLGDATKTATGTVAYRIGTRTANTVLRMEDGETQVLMGLIRDDDRKSASKVPGLGELPVLGRLFGSHLDDSEKTEIVLSITPRLVRNVRRVDARVAEFFSGTEQTMRSQPFYVRPVAASAEKLALIGSASPPGASAPAPSVPAANAAPATAAPAAPVFALTWQGPAQAKVGDEFTVTLRAKADQQITNLGIQLGFDAQALEVVNVAAGDFLRRGDVPAAFSHSIDPNGGKISMRAVGRAGGPTGPAEGDLLSITFKVVQPNAQAQVQLLDVTMPGVGGPVDIRRAPPHRMALSP
jgi:general secretion pathway protein D